MTASASELAPESHRVASPAGNSSPRKCPARRSVRPKRSPQCLDTGVVGHVEMDRRDRDETRRHGREIGPLAGLVSSRRAPIQK